jgi:hypothetical protein
VAPADTGITAANLAGLRTQVVTVPGTVDSSAVELDDVRVHGRAQAVAFMTTSYGVTFALELSSDRILWRYVPPGTRRLLGGPQITAATPVIDPDHRYLYAASPTGYVHKLSITTGRPVWSASVGLDPSHQKIASALTYGDRAVIAVTDGYIGDIPPYQGHVVMLDPANGRVEHVFNTLCSNRRGLIRPSSCPYSDSGIWGRSGAVVAPDGDILVATSNGQASSRVSFNGRTNWSDSVLELSPTLRLLHNFTPSDQLLLTEYDLDLGSTSPALLPDTMPPLALQGGKQGYLYLLDLDRLDGTAGPAGPRTGGELQRLSDPGQTYLFTAPAVWRHAGTIYAFVADDAGTAAYRLLARRRMIRVWSSTIGGTSPLLAGGLLYVYDQQAGALIVRDPLSGTILRSLPAAPGHWNSPIVVGGRIILPTGNDNAHLESGQVFVYSLPGA